MTELQSQVDAGIQKLSPFLREWVEAHICLPTAIVALRDPDAEHTVELLQLTHDTGIQDSSHAVAFDPLISSFGLVTWLADGRAWYFGEYGTCDEAVENM
jgi:hypothetical protein